MPPLTVRTVYETHAVTFGTGVIHLASVSRYTQTRCKMEWLMRGGRIVQDTAPLGRLRWCKRCERKLVGDGLR